MKEKLLFKSNYNRPFDDYEATAHFDGCCIPNPGMMGVGIVIEAKGNKKVSEYIGLGPGTNNLAEWLALYCTIRLLVVNGIKTARILGDSQLVINQIAGKWRVKDPTLLYMFERCRNAMAELDAVWFEWVPREKNSEADELSAIGARSNRV